jgi:transcriptional regulator with XRE-family HTH domain
MKLLGPLLRALREARGLSFEEVARRLRYRDLRKGVRRLKTVEATGQVKNDLLLRLLEVLGIDLADFEDILDRLRG